MANHSSALKRARQNKKRMTRNRDRINRVKTFIKKFIADLSGGNAAQSFSAAQSEIQKCVSKGMMHGNTADRKVSRLSRLLKSAVSS